jgi:hypothetical protein
MLHRAKDLDCLFGKEIEMDRACSTHDAKKIQRVFGWKPGGKRPPRRPRRRWGIK